MSDDALMIYASHKSADGISGLFAAICILTGQEHNSFLAKCRQSMEDMKERHCNMTKEVLREYLIRSMKFALAELGAEQKATHVFSYSQN
jgi:esterase/lipase superfamily enzyme